VQWLWAGNALNLRPGLQYFQYLLGFEIYNLVPARRSPPLPPLRSLHADRGANRCQVVGNVAGIETQPFTAPTRR